MEWNESDGIRALKAMQMRASCRSFEEKPIPEELLQNIIKTGLCAASGGNLQPVTILCFRHKKENEKLMEICENQSFIGQAAVNLLFLVDWHKMSIFAEHEKAPFTCDDSYMHFLIALEDVMCAAQSIETAAHLCGLGSCYVGTVNHKGSELIDLWELPEKTYPVVMLSLGYPKAPLAIRKKLDYDMMVFDGKYPTLEKEYVVERFRNKYGDAAMSLPGAEPYKSEKLEEFKRAVRTSFSEAETEKILAKAVAEGKINETQRRFGLHYHAEDMRRMGKDIIDMMEKNGLTPFKRNA